MHSKLICSQITVFFNCSEMSTITKYRSPITYLDPLVVKIKNRFPSLPLTKETLNKAPFDILPIFRHIREKYESLSTENIQTTYAPQSPA